MIAARLHRTIAVALRSRADYQDADREYAEAAALFQQAQGRLSQEAIITQLQRVAMLAKNPANGSMSKAKSLYAQQEPLIAKAKAASGELPAWNDFARGLIEMFDSDAGAAAATFEHGLRVSEALPEQDFGLIFPMKQSLAFAYTRLGEGSKAERLIRELIATETRIGYTSRPNPLNLGLNLAQAYMAEQKNQNAIAEINQISPALVRQLGPMNDLTVTALGVRAQAEASLGMWDPAAQDLMSVHAMARGKNVFYDLGSLSDGALDQCRGGHYKEGEANAREAYDEAREAMTDNNAAQSSFRFALAACEVGLHHLDQADQLLARVDVPAVAQLNADAEWPADVELTKAEIALQRRDFGSARNYLTAAHAACTRPQGAPYRRALFERLNQQLAQF